MYTIYFIQCTVSSVYVLRSTVVKGSSTLPQSTNEECLVCVHTTHSSLSSGKGITSTVMKEFRKGSRVLVLHLCSPSKQITNSQINPKGYLIPSGIEMLFPFFPSTSSTSGKSDSKLATVKRRVTNDVKRRCNKYNSNTEKSPIVL